MSVELCLDQKTKSEETFPGDAYSLSPWFRKLLPHVSVPDENGTHVNLKTIFKASLIFEVIWEICIRRQSLGFANCGR